MLPTNCGALARHKCTVTHSKAVRRVVIYVCCSFSFALWLFRKLCVAATGCYFTYFITIFFYVCAHRAPIICLFGWPACLPAWFAVCCCCFSYKNQLYFLVTVSARRGWRTRYTPKATWLLDLIAIRAKYTSRTHTHTHMCICIYYTHTHANRQM